MVLGWGRKGSVAVVELHGVIGTRVRDSVYQRIFDAVTRDARHKALLLDIESPGGSAAASEALWHSVRRFRETHRPVVAYIRGLGASGGYYVACAASQIVALPTALVGSIGVIMVRPVAAQLLDKLGLELTVYKGGRLKDMSGFWRAPSAEEDEKYQELIGEIYDNFTQVVAQGRHLEPERARELATGEGFTARRAETLGLVDHLGGFDDALNLAGQLADLPKPRPRWLRPRRGFSERLFGLPSRPGAGSLLLPPGAQRLLSGGIYYLDPAHLLDE